MKLTSEQIDHINAFLQTQYHLKFDNVRNEVLDHIATEIEHKLDNDIPYSEAFKITFSKWNKDLKASDWIGYTKVPRMIAHPMIKQDLSFQAIVILSLCLLLIGINLIGFDTLSLATNAILVFLSIIINLAVLAKNKKVASFRTLYYKVQVKNLNILNSIMLLIFGLLFFYLPQMTINVFYVNQVITFFALLTLCYNTYFVYRLDKVKSM